MESERISIASNEGVIPAYRWPARKARELVVGVHGLKSHAGWMADTATELARGGVEFISYDRAGSGKSSSPRGHCSDYRNWLKELNLVVKKAQDLQPQLPVSILGHCFGASIALAWALNYAPSTTRLILTSPPLFSRKVDISMLEKLTVLCSFFLWSRRLIQIPVSDLQYTSQEDRIRFIESDRLRLCWASASFFRESWRLETHLKSSLRRLTNPSLILLAQSDTVIENSRIESRLLPLFRNSSHQVKYFTGSHYLFFEPCRNAVIQEITTWLNRNRPRMDRVITSAREQVMNDVEIQEFGKEYTAAWCSRDPASVAAFFAKDGSLKINDGVPSVGREAISAAAKSFMTAFPDLVVTMDGIDFRDDLIVYRWTLTGTNNGPGGSGKSVCISGFEEWILAPDGLILESEGHFDEAEYNRQLKVGFENG